MAKSGTVGQPGAAYTFEKQDQAVRRHTFAVIVDNEPGVLARVIGLFSGRGYNIESLTVSTVTEDETVSRINIVTTGTEMVIEQIKAQLQRLVPVHNVHDLTLEGPHVEKELALVKVKASDHYRRESLRIADVYGAKVADTTLESFVFLIQGSPDKVDSFIELMQALGDIEVARSGVVAISRGSAITPV
ncbi:MAG: acetolactate synthase small subunit [Marivibrio sp.]|uniref:acetolactate synthase small subunit n=1 Tax=Marivibrio sp. TaxID=2039719 RepID=UPI0032EC06C9